MKDVALLHTSKASVGNGDQHNKLKLLFPHTPCVLRITPIGATFVGSGVGWTQTKL